ncbi:heat-inducible transcription repressor HrcA [bacterium]|nr:MAG: heat-inducible transcription repressor HrcA [bacterium]
MQERLTNREELILRKLVEVHIKTAEPVGSNTLSKILDVKLSPATIRNILAKLEDKNMLDKPHTSAGRIPTDNGYQYYVDNLMYPVELSDLERGEIRRVISKEEVGVFEVLESMARVLARLTNQLGVVIAPTNENLVLYHIDVIPLGNRKLFLILTTTGGLIRRLTVEFPNQIDTHRLVATCSLINERLGGLTLAEIRNTIRRRLSDVLILRDAFLSRLVDSADSIFRFSPDRGIHYFGTSQLLDQPEFRDLSRMKAVMALLENPVDLANILSIYGPTPGSDIRISRAIEGVAIVCSSYETGRGRGIVGVVGPPRMDYARAVSILSFSCRSLSDVFVV